MTDLTQLIEEAQNSAPTAEELTELQKKEQEAREIHEERFQALKEAAVGRARVFGWVRVAAELGTSPKMLHSWAKQIPGVDLSKLVKLEDRADG